MKKPLIKNCRVDFKTLNGQIYSVLIDFVSGASIYCELGQKNLKHLHTELCFMVRAKLEIDNFPYSFYNEPFAKIDGANYTY